tara:strand:+ start:134 stop:454 length:321 start_codon:yes stop_codon:yes gene_type:complete
MSKWNEKLWIVFENPTGDGVTNLCDVALLPNTQPGMPLYQHRMEWAARRTIDSGSRYEFISQSQFPPDWDNYEWDYTNCDGVGINDIDAPSYTASWQEYLTENDLL